MFGRVNRDRAKNGLPPLKYDPRLSDIGRSHSKDMRDNHFFEHESPTYGALDSRLHRAGYLFLKARENLAEAITVDDAEDGLLKSPHHYENLMAEDITHVGIGIVKGGVVDPRNLTVTQVFSTPGKRESNAEATAAIVQTVTRARATSGTPALARLPELDRLACDELAKVQGELDGSQLGTIGAHVVDQLGKRPIAGVSGVSAGAQVVVDSSQYQADGAILSGNARGYGLCVDHGPHGIKGPRLRVLVLVGLRGP
jgi:uncharacterized protein YkwD